MKVRHGLLLVSALLVIAILVSFLLIPQKAKLKDEQAGSISTGAKTSDDNTPVTEIIGITNITCEYCQYPFNNTCMNYSCCSDSGCSANKSCTENECQPINCAPCQYVENHKCVSYECCDDSNCNINEICSLALHQCINQENNPLCKELTLNDGGSSVIGINGINYKMSFFINLSENLENDKYGLISVNDGEFVKITENKPVKISNLIINASYIHFVPKELIYYAVLTVCGEDKYLGDKLSTSCGNSVCENQTLRLYTESTATFTLNSVAHSFRLYSAGQVSYGLIDGTGEELLMGDYYSGGMIYIKDYGTGFLDLVMGENKNSCPSDCSGSEHCGNGICENQTMRIYEGETKSVAAGNTIHKVELSSIEISGGSTIGYLRVDDDLVRISQENNYYINNLDVYVNYIFYTAKEAYRLYVTLTFGENKNSCIVDCDNL